MHHPYHHQPPASAAAADIDPEAVIARQEAMVQAGTHAMIAEKLARDAVYHQRQRDLRPKQPVEPAPAVAVAAPIIPDTVL